MKITYGHPRDWKNCKDCIETKHGIEDTTTFKFSHTKEDKMDMFDMSGHAKLSVMFDVVKLGSSFVGKYLKESTSSLDQIRFSYVKNEVLYTTFIGDFPSTPSEVKILSLLEDGFTHYVSAITCTTVIIVDFIKELKKGEDKTKKEAELKNTVKSLGWDVDVEVKSNMKKEKKDYFDELTFYYHGTVDSSGARTSIDEIVKLLNEKILPNATYDSSCKETRITLKPLDTLMKNGNKLEFEQLSQNSVDKATRIHNKIEELHNFFKIKSDSNLVLKLGKASIERRKNINYYIFQHILNIIGIPSMRHLQQL